MNMRRQLAGTRPRPESCAQRRHLREQGGLQAVSPADTISPTRRAVTERKQLLGAIAGRSPHIAEYAFDDSRPKESLAANHISRFWRAAEKPSRMLGGRHDRWPRDLSIPWVPPTPARRGLPAMTAAKTLGDQVGSCGGVGMAGLAALHLGALASHRPVAAIYSFSPDRVDQLPRDG